jgi:hypothetical protein
MPLISVTWEAKIGRLQFKASLGGKLAKLYLKNKSSMMVHVCNSSYLVGGGREIEV